MLSVHRDFSTPTSIIVVILLGPETVKVIHFGWSAMFSITMHHSSTPNGHMLQRIPKATGATLLPWGLLRAICMLCGMHVTTSLENILVKAQNFPSVPSPIITTSSVSVLSTIQMLFVQLHSTPMKPTILS